MRFLCFFLCGFVFSPVHSQDTTKIRKVKILPVPTVGYSPETRLYVGAVALFTLDFHQDDTTRGSNAKIEFNYTWNKQIIAEVNWGYFFKKERWRTKGMIHFSKYPDRYYGIGENTLDSDEVLYDSHRSIIEISFSKDVGKSFFIGPIMRYLKYAKVQSSVSNKNYSELGNGENIGFGIDVNWDTRNNLLSTSNGYLIEASGVYNLSETNYMQYRLDLRKYWNRNNWVLASRFLNEWNYNIPLFYDYAALGGDIIARGYFYGRFRDLNLSTIQLELRTPLVHRFGLAFFGGVSKLYGFSPLGFMNLKPNIGGGFRYQVDKADKINFRLDYAVGSKGNSGVYIAFGESF